MLLILNAYFVNSQTKEDDVKNFIKEFYTNYSIEYSKSTIWPEFLSELDSLCQIYCTNRFQSEFRELCAKGTDHDIFTGDFGMDPEDIQTINIEGDTLFPNRYLLTYTTKISSPASKYELIEEKIILYIAIKNENGYYKIDDIELK